jgi:hypothetical protein
MAENDREFWLEQRAGLLKQVEAIERRYLPEMHEERQEFRRWRDRQRFEGRLEKKRVAVT